MTTKALKGKKIWYTSPTFAAQTIEKNNKNVFVNPVYERKRNRWRMAFRRGKDLIAAE